jgi:hypothetical protein
MFGIFYKFMKENSDIIFIILLLLYLIETEWISFF